MSGVHRKKGWTPERLNPQVYFAYGMWMRTGRCNRYDASRIDHPAPSKWQQLLARTKRNR